MAFPTSPVTFTSFANGALSDASQVTAIYTEVEAIEAGYLNGTARLNSSHSTVAALSVTGGSTVAGLTVTSTASFASSVTFSSGVLVNGALTFGSSGSFTAPRPNNCYLRSSGAQAVANGAWTGLSWDIQDSINGGIHSTATNSSRITLNSTGLWDVGTSIKWAGANSSQSRFAVIRLNDNQVLAGNGLSANMAWPDTQPFHNLGVSNFFNDSSVNYITVQVYQDSGSTASVQDSTSGRLAFWARKVSA